MGSNSEVEEFTRDMTYETFATDKKTVNAVIGSLEVLGEAAKHIPASFLMEKAPHGQSQGSPRQVLRQEDCLFRTGVPGC